MDGYIGLGTNLGARRAHLRAGVEGLRRAGLELVSGSSVWESEPVDCPSPRWFLNMAVRVRTERQPLELLDLLLSIERSAGRTRGARNAPRTLDLDLLMLGDLQWSDDRLRLPHPRMWERRFVLEPLCEIAPDLRNPETGTRVSESRERIVDRTVVRRIGRL